MLSFDVSFSTVSKYYHIYVIIFPFTYFVLSFILSFDVIIFHGQQMLSFLCYHFPLNIFCVIIYVIIWCYHLLLSFPPFFLFPENVTHSIQNLNYYLRPDPPLFSLPSTFLKEPSSQIRISWKCYHWKDFTIDWTAIFKRNYFFKMNFCWEKKNLKKI
jgi:hypothetical protein